VFTSPQTFNVNVTIRDVTPSYGTFAIYDDLSTVYLEYRWVFDFTSGNFTELKHAIDTGTAKPIKLRMRRTPACFVDEEEAHLQKMLDARVIQPSISEWASAPVLIRKRDGGVRWCIDYRALNTVTV